MQGPSAAGSAAALLCEPESMQHTAVSIWGWQWKVCIKTLVKAIRRCQQSHLLHVISKDHCPSPEDWQEGLDILRCVNLSWQEVQHLQGVHCPSDLLPNVSISVVLTLTTPGHAQASNTLMNTPMNASLRRGAKAACRLPEVCQCPSFATHVMT